MKLSSHTVSPTLPYHTVSQSLGNITIFHLIQSWEFWSYFFFFSSSVISRLVPDFTAPLSNISEVHWLLFVILPKPVFMPDFYFGWITATFSFNFTSVQHSTKLNVLLIILSSFAEDSFLLHAFHTHQVQF